MYVIDGEDYRIDSTIVTVTSEEMLKSFIIRIINDDIAECDERFQLALSISTPPCEVVSGRNDISEVMIRDDDGRRSVSDYVASVIHILN